MTQRHLHHQSLSSSQSQGPGAYGTACRQLSRLTESFLGASVGLNLLQVSSASRQPAGPLVVIAVELCPSEWVLSFVCLFVYFCREWHSESGQFQGHPSGFELFTSLFKEILCRIKIFQSQRIQHCSEDQHCLDVKCNVTLSSISHVLGFNWYPAGRGTNSRACILEWTLQVGTWDMAVELCPLCLMSLGPVADKLLSVH